MKKYFLMGCCLLWMLSACTSKNRLEQNVQTLPMQWAKDEILKYEMKVADSTLVYDLKISARYHANTKMTSIPVKMHVQPPNGLPAYSRDLEIFIKTESGGLKGEAAGDIVDFCCFVAEENQHYKQGIYTVTLIQNSPKHILLDIMAMGVELWKK